jgi:hypothetical protein
LTDVILQHVIAHAEAAIGIELLLRQEEAVLAVKIADRTRRFGKNVKSGGRRGCHRIVSQLTPAGRKE